jgi:branched-chain amino acid transport system ATP-binding protein
MTDEPPILRAQKVTKRFGGVTAVEDVSLTVLSGRVHCLIGPNGAGKTTLFDVLSGATTASAGRVLFCGRDITRDPAHIRSQQGLVRTFQSPRPILTLTVRENLLLAASGWRGRHRARRLLWRGVDDRPRAEEILEAVRLEGQAAWPSELSHGARKRLELGMALACGPKLLLLDEPTAGMNAAETGEMSEIIRGIGRHTTVLVIEHDLDFVRRMADVVTVLNRGRVLCEGPVEAVEQDDRVREVYIGGRA